MKVGFGIVSIRLGGKRRSVVSASGAAELLDSEDWPRRNDKSVTDARRVVAAALEGHCTHRAASEAFRKAAREAGVIIELERV